MPLAMDGMSRHESSYVHCTLGGTSRPDQLASWWLLGGIEEWATLYAAAQEVDFDQQSWDASKVVFQDTSGVDRETLFFLCADGKAQILMANCKKFKAEASQAMVCWVIGQTALPTSAWKPPLTGGGRLCSPWGPYIDTS